jgi:hypothetical protein
VKHQWLDAAAKSAAQRTLATLGKHLTPDGFLGGVTQGNKSTEELQRGNYRVTYPMAMGLRAQLIAALTRHADHEPGDAASRAERRSVFTSVFTSFFVSTPAAARNPLVSPLVAEPQHP